MSQPLTHLGEIFREDFLSPFHIAENGGVIGNGALVNRGLTISANNQSVRYGQVFPNVNDFTIRVQGSFDIASSNDYGALFYFRVGTSANDNTIRIFKTPASSRLTFRIANGSGSRDCAMDSGTEVPETESMIHFTRSGNTLKVYVNGVEQADTTSGSSITGALPLGSATVKAIGFGDHVAAIKGQYKGWRMHNYAMSAEEIADDYNNSTFTYERSLVAHWPMNDKIGSAAPFTTTDVVGGNHLTLGDGSTSSIEPEKLTQSNGYSFSNDRLQNTAINERVLSFFVWFDFSGHNAIYENLVNFDNDTLSLFLQNLTNGFIIKTDGNSGSSTITHTIPSGANLVCVSIDEDTGLVTTMLNGDVIHTVTQSIYEGTLSELYLGTQSSFFLKQNMYMAGISAEQMTPTQAKHLYSQGPYYLGMK